jgi:hypothetical protein
MICAWAPETLSWFNITSAFGERPISHWFLSSPMS